MVSLIKNLFRNTISLYNETATNDSIDKLIKFPNLDMTEVWDNTEEIIGKDNHLYMCLLQYVAGNCWLNSKLSNGMELEGKDKEIYEGVNKVAHSVKPLTYPVTLFHGFEPYTNYKEDTWIIDSVVSVPGFLSKTPSFDVANKFAKAYNFFHRKFLVVEYPKGSKHIGMNVRHPSDPEYEYLAMSGEKLKLMGIHRKIIFPYIHTFYILKSIDQKD